MLRLRQTQLLKQTDSHASISCPLRTHKRLQLFVISDHDELLPLQKGLHAGWLKTLGGLVQDDYIVLSREVVNRQGRQSHKPDLLLAKVLLVVLYTFKVLRVGGELFEFGCH